jgi:glycosyltransferase involved in cell wall biosynthesis
MSEPRFLVPPPEAPVVTGPRPSFSVLVAAYDVAPYIGAALDSALAQVPPPYEIVVVDDGSTDDLDHALAPYRDRITFVRQENRGESGAKNTAARAASGDFVVILDADDVDLPGRLDALGHLGAVRPDLDILATDCVLVTDGVVTRRYHEPYNPFHTDDQRRAILRQNWIASPAVRRSTWLDAGGYDEDIRYGADWECWIRLILGGARAGLVDEPLFRYRQRTDSLTGDRCAILRGRVQVLEKTRRDPRLTTEERAIVDETLVVARRRYAREAVLRDRGARAAALAVVRDGGQPRRERVWGAVATMAPRYASRRAQRALTAGTPASGAPAPGP